MRRTSYGNEYYWEDSSVDQGLASRDRSEDLFAYPVTSSRSGGSSTAVKAFSTRYRPEDNEDIFTSSSSRRTFEQEVRDARPTPSLPSYPTQRQTSVQLPPREHLSMMTGRGHDFDSSPYTDHGLKRKTSPQHPLLKLDFEHVAVLPAYPLATKVTDSVVDGYEKRRGLGGSVKRDEDIGRSNTGGRTLAAQTQLRSEDVENIALLRKVRDAVGFEEELSLVPPSSLPSSSSSTQQAKLSNSWPAVSEPRAPVTRTREARSMIAPPVSSSSAAASNSWNSRERDVVGEAGRYRSASSGGFAEEYRQQPERTERERLPPSSSSIATSNHRRPQPPASDSYQKQPPNQPLYSTSTSRPSGESTLAYMRKYGLHDDSARPSEPASIVSEDRYRNARYEEYDRRSERELVQRLPPSAPTRQMTREGYRDDVVVGSSDWYGHSSAAPLEQFGSSSLGEAHAQSRGAPFSNTSSTRAARTDRAPYASQPVYEYPRQQLPPQRQQPRSEEYTRVLDLDRLSRLGKLPDVDRYPPSSSVSYTERRRMEERDARGARAGETDVAERLRGMDIGRGGGRYGDRY